MRVLVVMGNHSPMSSSVAICMEPLIKRMASSFDVDIVTDRKRIDIHQVEQVNGVRIHRVDDYRVMNTTVMNEAQQINSAISLRLLTKLFANMLKSCYYLRYVLFAKEKGTAGWRVNDIVDKCIRLHSEEKYDAVISISQPFQSHYAAERFVESVDSSVKWFVFEFDPFTYNKELQMSNLRRRKILKDEKRIFAKSDAIFLTPELYRFYQKTELKEFMAKATAIPFANLEPIVYNKTKTVDIPFKKHGVKCFFAGRLYHDIRNPRYAFDVFAELSPDINFTLLTNYSPEKINKEFGHEVNSVNSNITILPLQSRDTALHALMQADVLVNIGNTVEHQIPGKIFEYMSTGKPIIHFSKFPDDPALPYFKKYPLVFVVNEWEKISSRTIENVKGFCLVNKGVRIEFSEVANSFVELRGDVVAEQFVDVLRKIL